MEHEHECECGHHHESECDCEKTNAGGCCCEGGEHFVRMYQTREEELADLEGYLKELKLEIQAVEEHIQDLRK